MKKNPQRPFRASTALLALALALPFGAQAQTDEAIRTFRGHLGPVHDFDFEAGGGKFASVSDSVVWVWNFQTGRVVEQLPCPGGTLRAVDFHPSQPGLLATGGDNKALVVWDLAKSNKAPAQVLGAFSSKNAAATSPPPRRGAAPPAQYLADVPTRVTGLRFSNDGRRLYSSQFDNSLREWTRADSSNSRTIEAHQWVINCLETSNDGLYLLTASGDKTFKIWSASTGTLIRSFEGHWAGVEAAAFDRDASRVASASLDSTVKVWKQSGEPLRTYRPRTQVRALAFSPDGKYLATGGTDGLLRLWDLDSPSDTAVATFRGHSRAINALAFTPDGQNILTASDDATLKLWKIGGLEARLRYSKEIATAVSRLGAPQGEFETTEAYNRRMAETDLRIQQIYAEYEEKHRQQRRQDSLAAIDKIRVSLTKVTRAQVPGLRVDSIGRYDPDRQSFVVRINGQVGNLDVPIDQAPGFKAKYQQAVVSADRQLDLDGKTLVIFNIKVKHPDLQQFYPFGTQRTPYYQEPEPEPVQPEQPQRPQPEDDPFYNPDAKG